MKKYFETIFYGRGGLGAKSSAQFLAESAMLDGKEIQAFPEYGPERRGAPVRSFVRFSNKKIRIHQPITNPDVVIVIDDSLFNLIDDLKKFNTTYIINSEENKEYFEKILKNPKKIYVLDASKIAIEKLNRNSPNTVLIGAFSKIFNNLSIKSIENTIKEEFRKKAKTHYIKPNLECLKKGYNYFK